MADHYPVAYFLFHSPVNCAEKEMSSTEELKPHSEFIDCNTQKLNPNGLCLPVIFSSFFFYYDHECARIHSEGRKNEMKTNISLQRAKSAIWNHLTEQKLHALGMLMTVKLPYFNCSVYVPFNCDLYALSYMHIQENVGVCWCKVWVWVPASDVII